MWDNRKIQDIRSSDITVEQATNPETEVKGIIAAGSMALSQERDTIKAAAQEADAMEQAYTLNSLKAKAIITQEQQQAISHARSLRNIALLLFLFSIGSAVFAKPTRMNVAQADWIPAEQPTALNQALWLSGLGGLLSSIPAWGGVFSQLLFPSLCIGYFIIRRQLPKYTGDWKKVAAGGVGFGLLVSVALLIPYALAEKPITFAVSGFLFGLFIATAIEYASLPLTTRQFFLVAFIFSMARLAAYLSAESAGAELTVLEGIAAIFAVFWVIQVHASWVKSIRFDVLLVWFFVYSTVAFVLGNYFQAGFPQLLGSYLTTAISGGGLLAYYLSQGKTEKELLPGIQQDLTGKALLQSPQEA